MSRCSHIQLDVRIVHFVNEFRFAMYAPDPEIINSIIYYAANAISDVFGITRHVNSLSMHDSFIRLNVVARRFVFPDTIAKILIC